MSGSLTDLHQHILWGLDDGPDSPDGMFRMLELAADDGIGLIAATAHAYPAVRPFDIDLYQSRLREANDFCARHALPLEVCEGCEIHYADAVPDLLRAGRLPTLASSRYVLIEFNDYATFTRMEDASDRLFRAGYQPIIAHVERVHCLRHAPRDAIQFREECSFLFQMDCDAVLRPRGMAERRFVRRMLEAQAIDLVASDAHDTDRRPVCMRKARRMIAKEYGVGYARMLVSRGWELLNYERSGRDKP